MMKKEFVLIILIGLVVSFLFPDQQKGVKSAIEPFYPGCQIGKQYFVLIAIDKYQQWQPLQNPVKDAQDIKKILTSRYHIDEVIELYNQRATKKSIIALFRDLQGTIQTDDSLLVFYSGHGHLDDVSNNGFWIPVDGGRDRDVKERWIFNSEIRGIIRNMNSKHIFIIVDSCFSGDLLDVPKGGIPGITSEYFVKAYSRRCRLALTSGAREFVPDNSVFARQLILALKENNSPVIDSLKLYDEIRLGMKKTLPLLGEIKGTDHQQGGSFLFFLKKIIVKEPEETVVPKETYNNPFGEEINKKAKRIYKSSKGYWEADYGDGIIMVYIPAGEFTMGSNDYENEKPPHSVYLDGYWMGKTEVTVGQFKIFISDTGYMTDAEKKDGAYVYTNAGWKKKADANWRNPYFSQDDNNPVVCVSWNDAVAFCQWLSKKTRLKFELPTEAQWEKAARGTDGSKYPWGNNAPYYNGQYYANFDPGSYTEDGYRYTAPVGSFPNGVSPYGLLDMAGNGWEWCGDWYDNNYYKNSPGNNPTGPVSGSYRVIRGGSWSFYARNLRCASRSDFGPSVRSVSLGFRLRQDDK